MLVNVERALNFCLSIHRHRRDYHLVNIVIGAETHDLTRCQRLLLSLAAKIDRSILVGHDFYLTVHRAK